MQLNVQHEFVKYPQWYKNIEYLKEKERDMVTGKIFLCPGILNAP